MPKYDYKCTECGSTMESSALLREGRCFALDCKGLLKRVYSFGGFILKGSGWGKDKK